MLSLRPHQQDVVDKIDAGFNDGHRCQLLYAPTGFGKTEVAMAIMREVARKYKRTAMMLDRIVLVNQTSARLSSYGIDHGVMQADHWRYRPHERIQIVSAQTLEKRAKKLDIDLLIIDECHVQRASIVKLIKANPDLKVIGLTATPFTKGLGNVYTHIVGAKATGELIQQGWLTPLRVFIAKEIDMTGVTKVAGEWAQDQVTERGMKITGDIVDEWVKQTFRIFNKAVKTVVFCAGVAHGKDLERQFRERGYNFVSISYLEDGEFKKETIEEFSKPDSSIHGLIATDILTRGFDVPDVLIGVSARPFSKSFSSHVQQMGRVMRSNPGKEYGLWLCHSGNYLRFRQDWEDLFDNGVQELLEGGEKAKTEPTEKEKKESKCPVCSAYMPRNVDVCASCGHVREKRNTVSVNPGEMEELATMSRENKQKWWSMLQWYVQTQGKKPGWAFYAYKEKFGIEPRNLSDAILEPDLEVHKFVEKKKRAYIRSIKARLI